MILEDFQVVNDEKYITSAKSIINEKGKCRYISCSNCPFSAINSTSDETCDFNDKYKTRHIDIEEEDENLLQSAKQFLELVELQRRVESTTAKSMIEESDYLLKPLSNEEIKNTQAKFVTTLQEALRKEEEYIIVDQNSCICSEVNTLRLAEEFVRNSLKKDSDNTFTIYKKIKVGKAKINVETEWLE